MCTDLIKKFFISIAKYFCIDSEVRNPNIFSIFHFVRGCVNSLSFPRSSVCRRTVCIRIQQTRPDLAAGLSSNNFTNQEKASKKDWREERRIASWKYGVQGDNIFGILLSFPGQLLPWPRQRGDNNRLNLLWFLCFIVSPNLCWCQKPHCISLFVSYVAWWTNSFVFLFPTDTNLRWWRRRQACLVSPWATWLWLRSSTWHSHSFRWSWWW